MPARTALDSDKNRAKESIQTVALYALEKAGFFDVASFYGGTALRLFYGLDRFSEDLDFSLIRPDPDFAFDDYMPEMERQLSSFGLGLHMEAKEKTFESTIRSASVKGNTREILLELFPTEGSFDSVFKEDTVKVKVEVDVDPPPFARTEPKLLMEPYPVMIEVYDEPSLFAGKLHAVLCKAWKNRVKGRDLYDFMFYVGRGTQVNMPHLEARLRQTGCLDEGSPFDAGVLRGMLRDRFSEIDYGSASRDVAGFITDERKVESWCPEMFIQMAEMVR